MPHFLEVESVTKGGDRRLSKEAQDLDDHLRGVASDLGPSNGGKKRRPWKVTFLFLILLMAAIGVLFAVIFQPELFTSQSEPLDASGTESTVTDQDSAPSEPTSDTAGSIADGSIIGTWDMYWTNANKSENVGFTVRFLDDEFGTIEFPYDDSAYDGTFDVVGDQISFGFARDLGSGGDTHAVWDVFEGTMIGPDEVHGEWMREQWSCTPDADCTIEGPPLPFDSRLVRQP